MRSEKGKRKRGRRLFEKSLRKEKSSKAKKLIIVKSADEAKSVKTSGSRE